MIKKMSISIALFSVSLLTMGAISASATEQKNNEQIQEKKFFLKELQEEYGKEDKYYLAYEDGEYKSEVNPVSGKFKDTDKKTGQVEEYDGFNEVQPMTKEEFLKELQEEYGKEDKYYLAYEDDEYKSEVNPVSGKFKDIDKKTGQVEEYDGF